MLAEWMKELCMEEGTTDAKQVHGGGYYNASRVDEGMVDGGGYYTIKKGSRVSRPQPGCHYQTLPGRE